MSEEVTAVQNQQEEVQNQQEVLVEFSPEEIAMVRRVVGSVYMETLSESLKTVKNAIFDEFIMFINEKELDDETKQKIMQSVDTISNVSIMSYESVSFLASDNSPYYKSDKSRYFMMRELFKNARGYENKDIPAEIIVLEGYPNSKFIMFREGIYLNIDGDSHFDAFKEDHPNYIMGISVDPTRFTEVIMSMIINHLSAWITCIGSEVFSNEELFEFIQHIGAMLTHVAGLSVAKTYVDLACNSAGIMASTLRDLKKFNIDIDMSSDIANNVTTLVVSVHIPDENSDIRELLEDDGMLEDDRTMMDEINESDYTPEDGESCKDDKEPSDPIYETE